MESEAGPQLLNNCGSYLKPASVTFEGGGVGVGVGGRGVFVGVLVGVLVGTTGVFVGVGVALGALGVVRYRKLLLIIIVALALVLILPPTQGYVTHFFDGLQVLSDAQSSDLSTQMRVGEYSDALILIQRYPIFGVGFTGTPDIDTYLQVANLYLLMAGEMGMMGLTTFLIVMATLFISAWRVRKRTADRPEIEPMWWGFHTALFGALVGGVFDHYFFNLDFHHSVTLFWLYVGLAAVSTRLLKEPALQHEE